MTLMTLINKKHQMGFTLIELMIVVAIIGVLASIALPAYQTYVAKAKITSLVASAASGKTAIFERYVHDGEMPEWGEGAGQMGEAGSLTRDFWLLMKSISNTLVTVKKISETEVRINMILQEVNGNVNGKRLEFNYRDDGNALVFECNPAFAIPDKYLPKLCK